MQLTKTTLLAALSSLAAAASIPRRDYTPGDFHNWTIENARRVCDETDSECTWSFIIDTHREGMAPVPCEFTTKSFEGAPASISPQHGEECGPYVITSTWSGQFGPDQGFTTLSVIDDAYRLVAFPAYTDSQLERGDVVEPNLDFVPHAF
ncbi:hypothetical protein OQA88_2073 [Cercophora sp. LCS_1]